MSPIEQLRKAAREKRDADIQRAKNEYRATMRELSSMARRLGKPGPRKPRRQPTEPKPAPKDGDFSRLTVARAAELILLEGTPMTLVELAIEVQRRGCREGDDPRAVANAVRGAFQYHKDRFTRDAAGKWSLSG